MNNKEDLYYYERTIIWISSETQVKTQLGHFVANLFDLRSIKKCKIQPAE